MTTLITGGMGFIGLHTIESFLRSGERVVATFRETYRPQQFLAEAVETGQLRFVQVDIDDSGRLLSCLEQNDVDNMVHLAIHGQALSDPGQDIRTNMDKLAGVLDAARLGGVRRLSMASNSAVYADLVEGPFNEETPVPLTSRVQPGAFKKAWEVLAHNYMSYAASEKLQIVQMRISAVYGPLYTSMRNLASRLVHAAVNGAGPELGDIFDGDTNDFTFVKDVADAIVALQMAPVLTHPVYCVATGAGTTNAMLLEAVRAVRPEFNVQMVEGVGPSFRENAFNDSSRLQSELGWAPRYDIFDGIAAYAQWLEEGNDY